MRDADPRSLDEFAISFEESMMRRWVCIEACAGPPGTWGGSTSLGATGGDPLVDAGPLRSRSRSITLATNTWFRQTRRRAPGARIGPPEGPARGSGIALRIFTFPTTSERDRMEAS